MVLAGPFGSGLLYSPPPRYLPALDVSLCSRGMESRNLYAYTESTGDRMSKEVSG